MSDLLRKTNAWVMYAGMTVSMVGGATWPRPTWAIVAGGLVIVGAGIVMKRLGGVGPAEEHGGEGDSAKRPPRNGNLKDALGELTRETQALSEQAEEMDFEAIKTKVEALIWIGPERFGQSQEVIAAKVGFPTYAEVMAPLASAERQLYRAWSAAADGHRPECVASIASALSFAKEAEEVGVGKLADL